MSEKNTQTKKKKRSRSRHFPIFDLEKALDRARQLEQIAGTEFTSTSVAIEHWGYSSKSSGGMRTLAALIQYGLLDEQGMKDTRRVRVSSIARIILNSPDAKQKREATQDAALKPTLYKEVWDHYEGKLPTDTDLSWYLDGKGDPDKKILSENSVKDFIKSFRTTLDFAGLTGNGTLEPEGDPASKPINETGSVEDRIQVGDYIQWTSQGVHRFEEPRRVKKLSKDGKFIFVDGTETGFPIEDVSKCDAPTGEKENGGSGRNLAAKRLPPKLGMNDEVFALEEGEAVLRWPSKLSPESFEDLEAWLKIILRKAKRASEKYSGELDEGSTE